MTDGGFAPPDQPNTPEEPLPEKEQELIAHVRSQLADLDRAEADDSTIKRFIRATNGNLPLSIKRLGATLKWRREVRPETVVCTACAREPQSHYMHLVCYDKLNRPVIYSCLALARNKDFQDNYNHMIQTFEMAVRCMPPGVEQWVWMCDFHGFGLADVNPKLARAFLDMSAEHYPERLGLFLLVDAPSLFNMLWTAVSPFIDPKTYKKIRFLPYDMDSKSSKLSTELGLHFDETTQGWLKKEMRENRDRKLAPTKVYNMSHIYTSAAAGALVPPEGKEQHDVRGTPSLLKAYASTPDLLEPQGSTPASLSAGGSSSRTASGVISRSESSGVVGLMPAKSM